MVGVLNARAGLYGRGRAGPRGIAHPRVGRFSRRLFERFAVEGHDAVRGGPPGKLGFAERGHAHPAVADRGVLVGGNRDRSNPRTVHRDTTGQYGQFCRLEPEADVEHGPQDAERARTGLDYEG
ncbi:hypothetical protein MTR62_13295 [Novosphingobium sp. 1949]|uniref:Uncharacterized protein n=1 Tax=Novosphingobium organovorum TaxID=2930092 RepID=A0ABT0BF20_9SPHN|nr:hypothetical protein [Novosphingobium organovorum]MCJ2183658.1 hypothetical protein [Novosphingobium organovorum]